MKLGILIVNRNNLGYTLDLLDSLSNQTYLDFEVTIVDNGSTESLTQEKLNAVQYPFIKNIEYTNSNTPLNHLWNSFYLKNDYELYSFLNNDLILSTNYFLDTVNLFNLEPTVGCVAHSTNHLNYQEEKPTLEYVKFSNNYRQGWDFTMRASAYSIIPSQLHFFCGDDFIFEKLYQKNMEFAIITSSPIIHYQGMTPRIPGISNKDISEYKKLGFPHPRLDVCFDYSNHKPTFQKIIK